VVAGGDGSVPTTEELLGNSTSIGLQELGNKEFLLHSDVFSFAVEVVLSLWQQDSTGGRQQHVIGYFSRKLTTTECKYATYDRELMAICNTLQIR
jgi:hypothetical protein